MTDMVTGPQFDNNALNSPEQEGALKFWLDRVEQLAQQGMDDESIKATLATQGCPSPEQVLSTYHMRQDHPQVQDQNANGVPDEQEAPSNETLAKVKEVLSMKKGAPYPEHSYENAPNHSAPGHHLPKRVNAVYNACMREHESEFGADAKERCMKIAWSTHEKAGGEGHESAKHASLRRVANDYPAEAVDKAYEVADNKSYGQAGMEKLVQTLIQHGIDPETARAAAEHWTLDQADAYGHGEDHFPEGTFQKATPPWELPGNRMSKTAAKKAHYLGGVRVEIVSTYTDAFGTPRAVVSADGETADVEAEQLDVAPDQTTDPVALIEEFLSTIPSAEEAPEQRGEQLVQAHIACTNLIKSGKLNISQQIALDKVSLDCRIEAANLAVKKTAEQDDYTDTLPKFDYHGADPGYSSEFGLNESGDWLADVADQMEQEGRSVDYDMFVESDPVELVNNLPDEALQNEEHVEQVALSRTNRFMTKEQKARYLENVKKARTAAIRVRNVNHNSRVASTVRFDPSSVEDSGVFI